MIEPAKDRPLKRHVPEISRKKLKQLWKTQRKTEEIAILLNVSLPYLQALARRYKLPKRLHIEHRRGRKPNGTPEIDPTPEEIMTRAAEMRARWTERDYERNNCYKVEPVSIRSYSFDGRMVGFAEIHRDA